jgi:ribose transport system ATP-binding protein
VSYSVNELSALGSASRGKGRPARLAVTAASKTYGRTRVLSNVDMTISPGEIHALVGRTGSGKSTLVGIVSGAVRPDPGTRLAVDGQSLDVPVRPEQLARHGVSIVHQKLELIDDATVLDNIRMGRPGHRRHTRRNRRSEEIERIGSILAVLGCSADPWTKVGALPCQQRLPVAIARALQTPGIEQGCVVLDEPSRSLSREVRPMFHEIVRQLAGQGTAVLLVSRRLDEALALAHRVTVLRDGYVKKAGTPNNEVSEAELAALVSGQPGDMPPRRRTPDGGRIAVAIRDVYSPQLRGLDLTITPGEIVGVTGTPGSGHDDLARVLGGALSRGVSGRLSAPSGSMLDLSRSRIRDHVRAGIAYVPRERAAEGLALNMTAMENLTLPRITSGHSRLVLTARWQRREFAKIAALLNISPPRPDVPTAYFTSGNQQKILLGRWLLNRPSMLILHEPVHAVDADARADILRAVRGVADHGATVVICSTEAQDLADVCDRVLILRNGSEHRVLRVGVSALDILGSI